MDSRLFIASAKPLIERITVNAMGLATPEEQHERREASQKELNQLFAGLQNPTLPSAFKLRDTALRHGFYVNPKVLNELSRFE